MLQALYENNKRQVYIIFIYKMSKIIFSRVAYTLRLTVTLDFLLWTQKGPYSKEINLCEYFF